MSSHKTTRLINPKIYRVGMAINDYVRGGVALLSGIGLAVQLALPAKALGEDLYKVAKTPSSHTRYEDTNLASLGVPNWEGLTPKNTWRLERSPQIPGKETVVNQYDVDGLMVSVFSYNGNSYLIATDKDWKRPMDTSFIAIEEPQKFKYFNPDKRFTVPNWLLK